MSEKPSINCSKCGYESQDAEDFVNIEQVGLLCRNCESAFMGLQHDEFEANPRGDREE